MMRTRNLKSADTIVTIFALREALGVDCGLAIGALQRGALGGSRDPRTRLVRATRVARSRHFCA
jgi:hypothetical protein